VRACASHSNTLSCCTTVIWGANVRQPGIQMLALYFPPPRAGVRPLGTPSRDRGIKPFPLPGCAWDALRCHSCSQVAPRTAEEGTVSSPWIHFSSVVTLATSVPPFPFHASILCLTFPFPPPAELFGDSLPSGSAWFSQPSCSHHNRLAPKRKRQGANPAGRQPRPGRRRAFAGWRFCSCWQAVQMGRGFF